MIDKRATIAIVRFLNDLFILYYGLLFKTIEKRNFRKNIIYYLFVNTIFSPLLFQTLKINEIFTKIKPVDTFVELY